MTRMIFVNLPVADVERSAAFYAALGFTKDERFSQEGMAASMQWSDAIVVMLLSRDYFATFTPKPVGDSRAATSVLIALSQGSRAEVDAIVEAAAKAGGKADIRAPQDMGFMYGRTFEDFDGHVFEPMYMDLDAAMAAFAEPAEA
jgi:predicted lactoylglutathione lyase